MATCAGHMALHWAAGYGHTYCVKVPLFDPAFFAQDLELADLPMLQIITLNHSKCLVQRKQPDS